MFAAVAVLIVGLAVPVTASFIIAAVIIAPALVALGVEDYAAYMFIFYYAVLSEVSPPTALSAFAAAAITGGDGFRTMVLLMRYTAPAFLVPFAFVLTENGQGLLLQGGLETILIAVSVSAVAVLGLGVALGGWLRGPVRLPLRLLAGAGSVILLYLEPLWIVIGLAVLGVALAAQLALPRRAAPPHRRVVRLGWVARTPLAQTSVRDALDSALIALTAAGCDTPRLDAELLLADAMGVDRAVIVSDPGRGLTPEQARRFQGYAMRRAQREPVAYILGTKGFRTIDLLVDGRVLIPRPETEHLVEAALGLPRGARVADVGTGSGAVALALKAERPDLDVVATDASPEALAVARANAQRLALEVELLEGDLLEPVDGPAGRRPLQPALRRRRRPRHARPRHHPPRARDGPLRGRGRPVADPPPRPAGRRGRRGAARARGRLRPGRRGRGDRAPPRASPTPEAVADLAGIERVVVGRR